MQEQWWDTDVRLLQLRPAPVSDAYLINGLAGDSYPCSENSNTHSLLESKVTFYCKLFTKNRINFYFYFWLW